MSKLRILLVAPYKELCDVALKQVQEFPNITLDTCVGDLEKGLAAANAKNLDNFDIILSRGGTATLLEQRLQKPVVSIRLTGFDMLRFIKQAQNYKGKAAIVGYPIITEPPALSARFCNTTPTLPPCTRRRKPYR